VLGIFDDTRSLCAAQPTRVFLWPDRGGTPQLLDAAMFQ